ncbi:hypothetical protein Hanom_Chr15g01365581 [Helianthus anomalus]
MMSLNWMASLSRVSDSSSRHAAAKMVPPEVSYTPRLFIPTRRFYTMLIRPIPGRPPMSFSSVKRMQERVLSRLWELGYQKQYLYFMILLPLGEVLPI